MRLNLITCSPGGKRGLQRLLQRRLDRYNAMIINITWCSSLEDLLEESANIPFLLVITFKFSYVLTVVMLADDIKVA